MKHIIFLFSLLILGNLTFAADSPAPIVKKSQTVKNILPKNSNSVSPNIIPIITIKDSDKDENGIPLHEPCAATRMTPTLLITAAHCFLQSLEHGSRVNADIFEANDGVQGLVFSNPKEDNLAMPNAQIFLYRPQYTDPEHINPSFDFAVVVLDKSLKYNQASVKKILDQSSLNTLPENLRYNVKSMLMSKMRQKFAEQSAKYTKFINKQLDKVALLSLTPQGVVEELKGKFLKSYFWNGYPRSTERDSLVVISEKIDENEGGVAPDSSHMMLFKGENSGPHSGQSYDTFPQGTSGSPIFDTERKLVVSVASGVAANNDNTGGLIDESLCQWVKKHDSKVKCLVRHENEVPNEQETPTENLPDNYKPIVLPG